MAKLGRMVERRWVLDSTVLYKARLQSGLKQVEISELCGWSQCYYSRLEAGQFRTISEDTIYLLVEQFQALGIELEVEI